jgi:hypothetical protein
MGLMDKAKALLKGREKQVKRGIDTVSDQVERRAGKHAGKVDDVAQKAKQAVDSVSGSAPADVPSAGTPPTAPPSAATPPTRTTPAAGPPASTPPDAPAPDAPPV